MKTNIMNNLTRSFHKVGFGLKKHSPEILVAAGVVGVVTSAVMACKATTRIDEITDDAKRQIDKVHTALEHPEVLKEGTTYSVEDSQKDLTIIYVQTGVKLAKLYAPAIVLGAVSLTAIVASNRILHKRNVALAAAYTVIDKSFKEYRGRVVERFGEQLDKEIRYNIKAKEVEEVVVDENGNETTTTTTVEVIDPNMYSDYARVFDESCSGWSKNAEQNLMFLKTQQRFANDKLQSRGHLYLNEVYDMLDIPRSTAGQVVGWIYDEAVPVGDNFVDFGIYNCNIEKARDFVNGYERSIVLDFNVDGNILDMM